MNNTESSYVSQRLTELTVQLENQKTIDEIVYVINEVKVLINLCEELDRTSTN
jgi:hypothetical protein